MTDFVALIDRYLEAYSEPDPERRRRTVAATWAADGQLIDPPLVACGHAAIEAQADALLAKFPGHRFRRTSGIDDHHGHARYAWRLEGPDGAPAIEGCDFAELDASGRLRRVVGFFGPLPESPAS
jgi:hypothetical protein